MPLISVIVPTVTGREASFARCLRAYRERSAGARLEILAVKDAPTCGAAWINAARNASGSYLHFSADDHEPENGWWEPLIEACEAGDLPCPIVYNPDGSVQSAGGDLSRADCLIREVAEDWAEVPFTTVPTLSRAQWQQIGMIPLHYFTDVWVSERGKQLGIRTVLRTGSRTVHHNELAKRGAGMSQHDRARYDGERFAHYLREAA